jgi:heterodisulfide reductase subunit A
VHLVESASELGGNARRIRSTVDGADVTSFVNRLVDGVSRNPSITLHTGARIADVSGFVGNFRTIVENADGSVDEIAHGAAVIASGGEALKPDGFLYGKDPRVFSLLELEGEIARGNPLISSSRNVVFVQCVGSRVDERPYCSRTCCSKSVKLALALIEANPGVNVYVLYRDIRTYGFNEQFYLKARDRGVKFLRYDPDDGPTVEVVETDGAKRLRVVTTDLILGEEFTIDADLLGLATAIVPSADTRRLAGLFKVPLNEDGFFMEAHIKLRPVDFPTDGVFVCGLAHGPKSIDESIIQAMAAASRAALVLCRDSIEAGGSVAVIDGSKCSGCGTCAALCPFKAVEMDESEHRAVVNEALCKGCGLCASSCRCGAADVKGFTDSSIHAMIGSSVARGL